MRGRTIVAPKHVGWYAMLGARVLTRHPERIVAGTMAVVALVILGIGGASAATDSGPSSRQRPAQPPRSSSPVLAEGVRAIRPAALRVDGDSRHPGGGRDWKAAIRWTESTTISTGRRWSFRADPRRWPRLFANTTECTLSFNPITRRHWWQ